MTEQENVILVKERERVGFRVHIVQHVMVKRNARLVMERATITQTDLV